MSIIRKTAGFLARNFFDVRGALGVSELKKSFSLLGAMGKKVLGSASSTRNTAESFDAAVARLRLSEKDLETQYKSYQQGFYGYSAVSFCLFVYMLYLLSTGFYNAALVCLAVTLLGLIFTFRRHFWMFQIRRRKLGCTLSEWMKGIFDKKT